MERPSLGEVTFIKPPEPKPCPYGIFGIPIDSNMYEIEDR